MISGAISLGTFVAFMAYQMRLLSPVQGLMGLWTNFATAKVSLGRVHEILDVEPDVLEAEVPIALRDPQGKVTFDDVTFSFDRGGPVLEELSFQVGRGEILAVVGPSGSGKSTVSDLLARHMDPDSGRVLIDGQDLKDLSLADVRRCVVTVDQQPFVFNTSIAENIGYARPGASNDEITVAAQAAGLAEFIARLPEGIETRVGDRGLAISAGERQRIAVARALVANPAVLVLDEATASLDPQTQAQVIDGYEAAMRNRTTVLITHRLELARRAHRVIVVDGARVVAEGSPDELMSRRGPFRDLFGRDTPGSESVSGRTAP